MKKPSAAAWTIVGTAIACTACGGRSALLGANQGASNGAAGSTADGGAGTGGMGGSAGYGGTVDAGGAGGTAGAGATGGVAGVGGAADCPVFRMTDPPVGFTPSDYMQRFSPHLAATSEDGSRVAVATAELPTESPGPVAAHLLSAAFSPWESWPASLGDGSISAFVTADGQYEIDRGSSPETFAVAYPATPSPPATEPDGLFFARDAGVNGGIGSSVVSLATDAGSYLPRFVRDGAAGHLVGYDSNMMAASGAYAFNVAWVATDSSFGDWTALRLGCASGPLVGDAALVSQYDEYIFAFASGSDMAQCYEGVQGQATRVLVGRLSGSEKLIESASFSVEEPYDVVQFIRVLPAQGGVWLAYQYAGLTAEVPPPVMLVRLTSTGDMVLPATPILDGGMAYTPPALASLGDRLVMAWVDNSDPFGGTIVVRILDAQGNLQTETSHQPDAAWIEPRLELLPKPGGDQLLLGWSEHPTDANRPAEAWVAKYCVP